MKDRLLYLTIGLLIGIVVMQWTMPTGQASGGPSSSGVIAIEGSMVLDENGQTWLIDTAHPGPGWYPGTEHSNIPPALPVPLSEVKFWAGTTLITQDNVAWRCSFATTPYSWVNCGPWPGGPVPTSPKTWGGIKGKYDGNK